MSGYCTIHKIKVDFGGGGGMLTKEILYSVQYQIDHNINKRCVDLKNIQTFCETG